MLSQKDREKVCEIANYICIELLDIQPVKIRFERNDGFSTQTTKAVLCIDGDRANTIFIDPACEFDPEIVFIIAHELRHLYQYQIYGSEWVQEKQSAECTIEEYNMQLPEVDANAFGKICMIELTGCSPLFKGMSQDIKDAISDRDKFIIENEFEN